MGKDEGSSGEVMDAETAKAKERGAWGSQLEFILTCVGYAVGLGNVWRFPYLAFKNGGGAFLVPYILMLLLCGIPVFCFEISFGQFASLGPLKIWTVAPMWKGVGFSMVVVSTMVCLSYTILLAYIIYFLLASFSGEVPWSTCDNIWNTKYCMDVSQIQNKTYYNWYLNETNITSAEIKTPSEEYYYNEVLKISGGIEESGDIVWQLALCLLLAWIVIFLVLFKGIASLGKVVYFTSTFPYIMMTVMVVRGVTLEGATKGIEFYLTPDFGALNNAEVWSDAASQIFYSLSTCSGGLIAMASYNNFKNNVMRDSMTIPFINCATSLFAGFAIFSVLGFMANLKDTDVANVAQSGPGLVFVVYPEGLSQMPVPTVWAILFFLMMITLGFSSAFSMVESIVVAVMDEFPDYFRANPSRPTVFRGILCIFFYLISLPMVTNGGFYLFNIVDNFAGGFPRILIGVAELAAVIWVYGLENFSEDLALMLGRKPNIYFKATWTVLAPVIIIGILVARAVQFKASTLFNGEYVYPGWADTMGWLMVAFPIIWIPILIVVQWFKDGFAQVIKKSASPTSDWGPALPENKTGKYTIMNNRNSMELPPYNTVVKNGTTLSYRSSTISNEKQNGYMNGGYSQTKY